LLEVGVVPDAHYVGGGHGGFESTQDRVDLRPAPHASMDLPSPGNLLPSPFTLHLSLVLLTQGPRRRAPLKAPAGSSVWPKLQLLMTATTTFPPRRQQLLFLHDGNNGDGRVLGVRVDFGVAAEE
jgi:hypothetical protein